MSDAFRVFGTSEREEFIREWIKDIDQRFPKIMEEIRQSELDDARRLEQGQQSGSPEHQSADVGQPPASDAERRG